MKTTDFKVAAPSSDRPLRGDRCGTSARIHRRRVVSVMVLRACLTLRSWRQARRAQDEFLSLVHDGLLLPGHRQPPVTLMAGAVSLLMACSCAVTEVCEPEEIIQRMALRDPVQCGFGGQDGKTDGDVQQCIYDAHIEGRNYVGGWWADSIDSDVRRWFIRDGEVVWRMTEDTFLYTTTTLSECLDPDTSRGHLSCAGWFREECVWCGVGELDRQCVDSSATIHYRAWSGRDSRAHVGTRGKRSRGHRRAPRAQGRHFARHHGRRNARSPPPGQTGGRGTAASAALRATSCRELVVEPGVGESCACSGRRATARARLGSGRLKSNDRHTALVLPHEAADNA